jgi:serine/threonine-protein kinase
MRVWDELASRIRRILWGRLSWQTARPMSDGPSATVSNLPLAQANAQRRGVEEGSMIAERYRVVRELGKGAMGAVYLVEHAQLRKRYALKVMLPEATASPELVARFEREAVTAGAIDHPGVAQATDFGRLEDGSFFLVLEYVDGRSLRSVLEDGPLHPARALHLARQILLALHAAHAKGVVHRDIKPENVMLVSPVSTIAPMSGDGRRRPSLIAELDQDAIKILDFGIAKIDANSMGEGAEGGPVLTRAGAIYGTPAYMAPEQAMGGTIDARVDLYAVGTTLYEMIAGAPPFEGEPIEIIAKLVTEEMPPLASPIAPQLVTAELQKFVARLLAKTARDRPESAEAAIVELDAVVEGLASVDLAADVRRAITGAPPPMQRLDRRAYLWALAWLRKTAPGAGVSPRALGFAILGAGTALFLALVAVIAIATRPAPDDDGGYASTHYDRVATWWHDAPTPIATSSTPSSTTASTAAKSAGTAPSTPSSTASAGGKGRSSGGGGGVINKVKGIFR